jgi:uncharacterized protein YrrD
LRSVKGLLGKEVRSLSGSHAGIVSGLLVDPSQIRLVAVLVTRTGLFRSQQMIYWQDLIPSDTHLTIESQAALRPLNEIAPDWWGTHRRPGLWGRPIYDDTGRFVGRLSDLLIDRLGRVVGCRVSDGALKDLLTGQTELVGTIGVKGDGEGLELVGAGRGQA